MYFPIVSSAVYLGGLFGVCGMMPQKYTGAVMTGQVKHKGQTICARKLLFNLIQSLLPPHVDSYEIAILFSCNDQCYFWIWPQAILFFFILSWVYAVMAISNYQGFPRKFFTN